jgi:hypothetical protein
MVRIFTLQTCLIILLSVSSTAQSAKQNSGVDFCISITPLALMQGVYFSKPKYKIGAQFGTFTNSSYYFRQLRLDVFLHSRPLIMPDIVGYIFLKSGIIHHYISGENLQSNFTVWPITAGLGTIFSNNITFTLDLGPGIRLFGDSIMSRPNPEIGLLLLSGQNSSGLTLAGALSLFIPIF